MTNMERNALRLSALMLGILTLSGCGGSDSDRYALPTAATTVPFATVSSVGNAAGESVEVRNGGFGSAMTAHPDNAGHFYALTDRGPNAATAAGTTPSGIIFVAPEYTPRIGHFRLNRDGEIERVREILLKDPTGRPISGLPNRDFGSTGETPYALGGEVVALDPDGNGSQGYDESGLDGEGLVALSNGTFWVSDEYGPHMVHFGADGKELARINPFAADARNRPGRVLPPELSRRWPNRGMEGLAVTPDERTLVGIMQSSLDNPSQAAARSTDLTRIVTVELSSGVTHQYLYRQETSGHSNSEISTLSATRYLVVERDQKFFGRAGNTGTGTGAGNVFKRLYTIDLANATNVDTSNAELIAQHPELSDGGELGLLVGGKTLEQFIKDNGSAGWNELAALGIVPVAKTLAYDAIADLQYPHDKFEGVWVIDADTVGIINDDDFAIEPDGSGGVKQKVLSNGNVDGNVLYVVKPNAPLF